LFGAGGAKKPRENRLLISDGGGSTCGKTYCICGNKRTQVSTTAKEEVNQLCEETAWGGQGPMGQVGWAGVPSERRAGEKGRRGRGMSGRLRAWSQGGSRSWDRIDWGRAEGGERQIGLENRMDYTHWLIQNVGRWVKVKIRKSRTREFRAQKEPGEHDHLAR